MSTAAHQRMAPTSWARQASASQLATHCLRGGLRAAGGVYLVQLALRALSPTVRVLLALTQLGRSSGALRKAIGQLVSSLRGAAGNVRLAAFLGALVSAVRAVVALVRRRHGIVAPESPSTDADAAHAHGVGSGGKRPTSRRAYAATIESGSAGGTAAAIAGVASGVALLLAPPGARAHIAWFAAIRALEAVAGEGMASGWLPTVPGPPGTGHVLLYMVASAQIVWATVMARDSIDASFRKFLAPHVGQSDSVLRFIATSFRPDFKWSDALAHPELAARGLPAVMPPPATLTCALVHSGTSCAGHYANIVRASATTAIRVFATVHALPSLLFAARRKALLADPAAELKRVAVGTARSTAFLSLFSGGVWAVTCANHRALGIHRDEMLYLCGFIPGAALALETGGRRQEVALYVFGHACRSYLRLLKQRWSKAGGVAAAVVAATSGTGAELVAFAGAVAVLVRAFLLHPQLLRHSYARLVATVVGD